VRSHAGTSAFQCERADDVVGNGRIGPEAAGDLHRELKIGRDGRHDWIRTNDLFRVKASISHTFNNLQAAGDCQTTRKYVEDESFSR
jgi:hypothetical protein